MGLGTSLALGILSPLILFAIYVFLNDVKLRRLPPPADKMSSRWTEAEMHETKKRLLELDASKLVGDLPPKTGRRYIVVGGAGFLGGWIVLHLLQRGEDPRRIRILDIRPPERKDLQRGPANEVDFIQVDITDAKAVDAAFAKPWPSSHDNTTSEITVFHTAATIRFFERHEDFLPLSERVNVHGTKNIVEAARRMGITTFVYTSSGSVAVRRSRFWLWPWQREPRHFVQVITDDDAQLPKAHNQFFSNYAVSKLTAERYVRSVDRSPLANGSTMRTGCLRPGNGIYGRGGDILVDRWLSDKVNPTWNPDIMQSFIYVENCSLAHLCYEQRLIELHNGSTNPDIGGQAFCITDAGPTPTYGDVHNIISTLTNRRVSFQNLSPTFMLTLAHAIEVYYLSRHFLMKSRFAFIGRFLPALSGDLMFLQPSIFALTGVHLVFDDSRARSRPEEGGLGYGGRCTTIEGVCQVLLEHAKDGSSSSRAISGHPEPVAGHGFNLTAPEKGVGEIMDKISSSTAIRVDPTEALREF